MLYGQLHHGRRAAGGPKKQYKDQMKTALRKCKIRPEALEDACYSHNIIITYCGVSLRDGRPTDVSKHAPGVSTHTRTQQRHSLRLGEVVEGRYLPRYLLDQRDVAHLRC